jgi:hypothetical protein
MDRFPGGDSSCSFPKTGVPRSQTSKREAKFYTCCHLNYLVKNKGQSLVLA